LQSDRNAKRETAFVNEISAWLEGLGLGQYAGAFVENAVDLDVLPDLSEADFERLGVPLGDRKRILRALSSTAINSRGATTGSTAPALRPEAERRQLTVLFCDLVGSTVLAVRLDPEDLSAVIRRFQATSTGVITSYGGYVAKFLGDGLLAYFGYPAAHEDEAENAVRAGLDLVAKVGRLLLASGEALQVRVGVATGLVVVTSNMLNGSLEEVAATGETPNLAARLQELATPNAVVVSEVTRRLLGGGFVCERLGPQKLKGFSEPVQAYMITGETAVESRFDAKIGSKLTQFVGRRSELALLETLWERAKKGEGQVALICGEPGIGKSRISLALTKAVADEHGVIRWQCSPNHINSPFYPVIRNLERAARFEREDAATVKLEKLERLLSRYGQAMLADAPLIAALLSIPNVGRYERLELTPQRRKDLTIDSLIRQALAFAPEKPVLALLEDVHWMDPTTLELLDRTVEAIKPSRMLILMTFRPDFFAPWLGQPHVTMLRLERLSKDEVGTMLADLTGGKGLPAELSEVIVSKTDGVPLFVEEMTKAILETGVLDDGGERSTLQRPISVPSIPVTLHDSLMARLDRLAPIKEVAQIGAAIGREFPYRLLAAVAPLAASALDSALSQLTAADLIYARGHSPDSTYVFKHALVQDAAYASLLRSKRQQLHGNIAHAIEGQFPEIVETQPELMAHHLEQAGLPKQAVDYLRKAGQLAIERSAHAEAIGHLMRALELLEPVTDTAQRQVALELEVLLGQAMIGGRGYAAPETQKTYLRAKALFDDWTEPAQKFAVLYGLWANYYVGGDGAKQRVAAAEFLAEAERHSLPSALCLSHRTVGTTYVTIGEFDAGRRHLQQARALYERGFESAQTYYYGQDIGATALCYLCWALWQLGYVDQASDVAAQAVAHAEALSDPFTVAYAICHARGMVDIMRRQPGDTSAYAQRVVSLCGEHGFPFWGAGGQILDGWAKSHDDPDNGVELIRTGLAAWRKTGARLWLPIFVALEGEAHAAAGRSDAALRAVDEAIAISSETGERWAIAEVLRLKAQILSKSGRGEADEIEALLNESMNTAGSQGAKSWRLRTACDLVQFQRGRSGEQEALRQLQSIYQQFTEGFGTPDLINAKALLEAASAQGIRGGKAQEASAGTRTNERSGRGRPRARS
jgi:class 3 adenylate cyclase/tetratricopeptide (TPR) repeat protein